MCESKGGVFLIAGILLFVIAFAAMGVLPRVIHAGAGEQSVEQIAAQGILHEFVELREHFAEPFERYYGEVSEASFAEALRLGHQVYVSEACWQCHTQRIRPVSNEDGRWGPVSRDGAYRNELQRPALWGSRRVGPDLVREGALRSNDWHLAHFYKPSSVVGGSIMPEYRWFFDEEGVPNKRGMAIVTYVQWLGSRLDEYPYFLGGGPAPLGGPDSAEGDHRPTAGIHP